MEIRLIQRQTCQTLLAGALLFPSPLGIRCREQKEEDVDGLRDNTSGQRQQGPLMSYAGGALLGNQPQAGQPLTLNFAASRTRYDLVGLDLIYFFFLLPLYFLSLRNILSC